MSSNQLPIDPQIIFPLPIVRPARMGYGVPRLSGALKFLQDPQRSFGLSPTVDNGGISRGTWSGTSVSEYAAAGNSGTMQGGMESAQIAHAAAFDHDGVDDFIDWGDIIDVGSHDFLWAGWIKNSTDPVAIVSKKAGNPASNPGYSFRLQASGFLEMTVSDGTNQVITTGDGTLISDDIFHFISVVVDRRAGLLKRYVDCLPYGTVDDISAVTGSLDTSQALHLGRQGGSFTGGFHGLFVAYVFDGGGGAPANLISNYEGLLTTIMEHSQFWYK